MTTFTALGLAEPLLRGLATLGYARPTPVQAQAIPAALAGRDLMATAQTGTGKTAAFALPLLQRLAQADTRASSNLTRALILVPTRELAEQVHQSIRDYAEYLPVRTAVAYGGVSINPQMMALRKGLDILVATPGRLLDLYDKNAVRFGELAMLVLDEADRMLDLGFADELDRLLTLLPKRRQTLLFSATFSDSIKALAGNLLNRPVAIDISPRTVTAPRVEQWLIPVDKRRKTDLFCHLLQARRWPQVMVFARTRKGVDRLVADLQDTGVAADAIHGDKPQPARLRALQRFKDGVVQVLVATDVAARGLDIDAMPVVVNFDLPITAEDYVHRIGRTGRAGSSGQAISLVCADEVEQLAAIEALIGRPLPRREEPEFEPDHRVPPTASATAKAGRGRQKSKQTKAPKQKGESTQPSENHPLNRPAPGTTARSADDEVAPAVRPSISFSKPPKRKR